MHSPGRPGLVSPPEELSARVRSAIRELGVNQAAESMGLTRETILLIGSGAFVTRGSLALAERQFEALARSGDASSATVRAS